MPLTLCGVEFRIIDVYQFMAIDASTFGDDGAVHTSSISTGGCQSCDSPGLLSAL
jgi:hypothetical protein